MNYGILFERIQEPDFPSAYYYAHIPALGLTAHGLGVEGAREAARDLVRQWIDEKRAQHEPIPAPSEVFFSTLELPDDAIQST
jgi:predicted RNase H-like HicB family nuclease